jgi:hypothetical protein
MRIIITESQLKKIILEQESSDFQGYFNKLKGKEIKMETNIPEINLGKGVISVDDFISKINKSPFKVTSFYINTAGYNFPIVPASFTLERGGKTISLSTEPFDTDKGYTMIKLTKSLGGVNKKKPKEI